MKIFHYEVLFKKSVEAEKKSEMETLLTEQ